MNYVSNQNGKVLKETVAGSRFCINNIEMSMLFQNEHASLLGGEEVPFLVAQVSPFQNSWLDTHFVLLAKIT